jgi:hypothetical protein
MRKVFFIIRKFRFCATVLLLTLALAFQCFAQTDSRKGPEFRKPPKFEVVKVEFTDPLKTILLLDIVIAENSVNPEDLKYFSKKINDSYPDAVEISAGFFLSKRRAKNFKMNQHDPDYQKQIESYRAIYQLNRKTGNESLKFVPIGQKAFQFEDIKLDSNL